MTTLTLSSKYQIVVPKEVRQMLGLEAGAKIYISPINENQAVITKEPANHVEALRGLGKDVWDSLGGGEAYLKRERASWDERDSHTL